LQAARIHLSGVGDLRRFPEHLRLRALRRLLKNNVKNEWRARCPGARRFVRDHDHPGPEGSASGTRHFTDQLVQCLGSKRTSGRTTCARGSSAQEMPGEIAARSAAAASRATPVRLRCQDLPGPATSRTGRLAPDRRVSSTERAAVPRKKLVQDRQSASATDRPVTTFSLDHFEFAIEPSFVPQRRQPVAQLWMKERRWYRPSIEKLRGTNLNFSYLKRDLISGTSSRCWSAPARQPWRLWPSRATSGERLELRRLGGGGTVPYAMSAAASTGRCTRLHDQRLRGSEGALDHAAPARSWRSQSPSSCGQQGRAAGGCEIYEQLELGSSTTGGRSRRAAARRGRRPGASP
jgi:hypothetical protein